MSIKIVPNMNFISLSSYKIQTSYEPGKFLSTLKIWKDESGECQKEILLEPYGDICASDSIWDAFSIGDIWPPQIETGYVAYERDSYGTCERTVYGVRIAPYGQYESNFYGVSAAFYSNNQRDNTGLNIAIFQAARNMTGANIAVVGNLIENDNSPSIDISLHGLWRLLTGYD